MLFVYQLLYYLFIVNARVQILLSIFQMICADIRTHFDSLLHLFWQVSDENLFKRIYCSLLYSFSVGELSHIFGRHTFLVNKLTKNEYC